MPLQDVFIEESKLFPSNSMKLNTSITNVCNKSRERNKFVSPVVPLSN